MTQTTNQRNSQRTGILLWGIPLTFVAIFFFLPLGRILWTALQTALNRKTIAFSLSQITGPLWFTTWQAALSTILTLILGLPAAYLFARYQFRGKQLL